MSFNVADVPILSKWVLVTEAADMLGLSKQAVHGLIRKDEFKTLHRVGENENKPIYVIDIDEVKALVTERAQSH